MSWQLNLDWVRCGLSTASLRHDPDETIHACIAEIERLRALLPQWSTDIGAAPINTPLLVQLKHNGQSILTVVEITEDRRDRRLPRVWLSATVTMPCTDSDLYSLVPVESITHWQKVTPP